VIKGKPLLQALGRKKKVPHARAVPAESVQHSEILNTKGEKKASRAEESCPSKKGKKRAFDVTKKSFSEERVKTDQEGGGKKEKKKDHLVNP